MLKLLSHIKKYYILVLIVLILVFFQSLSQLFLPTLMSDIVDIGIIKGDINYILRIGGFMLLIAFAGMVCTILASYLSAKVAIGFSKDLRNMVFSKVESFSLQEFNSLGTSSLITRTTNDITQIERVTVMILRMMISAPMLFIGGVIMALGKDKALSLIILVVIPVLFLTIFLLARKALPLFKEMQKRIDKLNLVSRESLTGIRVIRAFNRDVYEQKRFTKANYDLTSTAIKVNQIMAGLMPIIMLVMNLTTIAIVWFGGIRIDMGYMEVGDMMAFIQYVMQIMFSLVMVSMMFIMIPRASVSAERINDVLDLLPDIKDPPEADKITDPKGVVTFHNVTFSYPGAEKPVLKDISFSAVPGKVTAIIGSTGSGKSTLISLIPRFYDIDSGRIMIDGVDIRKMSQKYLRSLIGFVPQQATLFSGTISDNIRYGNKEASIEEVKGAAQTAQALEFINNMPEGFNSPIAQGGNNLSGGQKQRLSIARALVRKPKIFIFDDSFSALDLKTDAKLRQALKKEISNATMIIVAQRVSSIMDADQIIVLENGTIVGSGKHKELLNNCDVYREIVASQLAKEESA